MGAHLQPRARRAKRECGTTRRQIRARVSSSPAPLATFRKWLMARPMDAASGPNNPVKSA